eukprot:7071028-Pyramimonas_sp.AAC.1
MCPLPERRAFIYSNLQELHRRRAIFKMWLSPERRAHSVLKFASASRMEGGPFSHLALALAPRTF